MKRYDTILFETILVPLNRIQTDHCGRCFGVIYILYFCCCIFQDAFSLLAYSDPWSSPVGCQLDPVQREPVCAALNSAILGEHLYLTFSLILEALVLS